MNRQELARNELGSGLHKDRGRLIYPPRWWLCTAPLFLFCLPLFLFPRPAWAVPNPPPKPYLVKDFAPGISNGLTTLDYLQPLIYAGNTLYIVADDGEHGWELWGSNGATNGTKLLRDINPTGSAFDITPSWENVNGMLYFGALDGDDEQGLWQSDGTAAGTKLVKQYGYSHYGITNEMVHTNDLLYFSLYDLVAPVELWRSDGTTIGTTQVLTLSRPAYLTPVGNEIYYAEYFNFPPERALWKTDGTATGTVKVRSFITPRDSEFDLDSLTAFNGRLYFEAYDAQHGVELWQSDGTTAGTTRMKDLNPGVNGARINRIFSWNGALYFAADDGVNGPVLWRSDGTAAGTLLLKDINLTDTHYPFGGTPSFVPVADRFYFIGNDDVSGYELWQSDGTAAGTVLVKDINPGPASAFAAGNAPMTAVNGILYFAATDGVTGVELWRSDGTAAGTTLVADLRVGSASAQPSFLVNGNGTLYFAADDGVHGMELWGFNPAVTPRAHLPAILR